MPSAGSGGAPAAAAGGAVGGSSNNDGGSGGRTSVSGRAGAAPAPDGDSVGELPSATDMRAVAKRAAVRGGGPAASSAPAAGAAPPSPAGAPSAPRGDDDEGSHSRRGGGGSEFGDGESLAWRSAAPSTAGGRRDDWHEEARQEPGAPPLPPPPAAWGSPEVERLLETWSSDRKKRGCVPACAGPPLVRRVRGRRYMRKWLGRVVGGGDVLNNFQRGVELRALSADAASAMVDLILPLLRARSDLRVQLFSKEVRGSWSLRVRIIPTAPPPPAGGGGGGGGPR